MQKDVGPRVCLVTDITLYKKSKLSRPHIPGKGMSSSVGSEKFLNGFSSHLRFQLLTISDYVYMLGGPAIVPTSVSCSRFLCSSNAPSLFLLWDRCTYCLAQPPPTTFLHVIPDFYMAGSFLLFKCQFKCGLLGEVSWALCLKESLPIPSRHSQPHSLI